MEFKSLMHNTYIPELSKTEHLVIVMKAKLSALIERHKTMEIFCGDIHSQTQKILHTLTQQ